MLKILNKVKVRLFKRCSKQITTSEVRKYFLLFYLVRKQGKENLKILNRFSEMDDDFKDKLALDENQRESNILFMIEALIHNNSIKQTTIQSNQHHLKIQLQGRFIILRNDLLQ